MQSMFASLKNKIREETGNDLSKLTAKITATTAQRIDSLRGLSQHGSSSSINSLVSSEGGGARDDPNRSADVHSDNGSSRTATAVDDREHWRDMLRERDRRIRTLEREKDEAQRQISSLKQSLKSAEDSKQKLVEHHVDNEQIESFQVQELSKVKQLVLLREQELAEKTQALKDAQAQIQKHRNELVRLRRQEEQLSDVQLFSSSPTWRTKDDLDSLRHSSARDLAVLAADLAKSEEERRHLADIVAVYRQHDSQGDVFGASAGADSAHQNERRLLEERLEAARVQLADIKVSWSEKITSLETQVGRLSRQVAAESAERRAAVEEKNELREQARQLEAELECHRLEVSNRDAKMRRLTGEVEEMAQELKTLRAESDDQVMFLRNQINNVNTEIKAVRKNLENTEAELEKNEDECGKLRVSVDAEHQTNNSLRTIISRLEKELIEEKNSSLNVQKTLTRVTTEKNAALLRNAEISQQMEIVKLESGRQENEMSDLLNKITQLECENKTFRDKEKNSTEADLRNTINALEEQLADKNKNIKTLQLRLADMKKTLQQELRTASGAQIYADVMADTASFASVGSAAILAPSYHSTTQSTITAGGRLPPRQTVFSGAAVDNIYHASISATSQAPVNFTYLKHVIIKFLTSREYEAQHLIRAVSTLLQFTAEEEKLLHDTLEWKRSWFGSRPKLPPSTAGTATAGGRTSRSGSRS